MRSSLSSSSLCRQQRPQPSQRLSHSECVICPSRLCFQNSVDVLCCLVMNQSVLLPSLLSTLIQQCKPQSVLLAGDLATICLNACQDTRLQTLTTPFTQSQLTQIQGVDLAVISDLTETLPLKNGQQWLGYLRNLYAPHIILITDPAQAQRQGWMFCDYLAMGLQHIAGTDTGLQLFSYAIENYQPKHDWLNSRFWANPENY